MQSPTCPLLKTANVARISQREWMSFPPADAEAATIPFIWRFSVALAHFQKVDTQEIIADNGLHRLDKWIKATPRHQGLGLCHLFKSRRLGQLPNCVAIQSRHKSQVWLGEF